MFYQTGKLPIQNLVYLYNGAAREDEILLREADPASCGNKHNLLDDQKAQSKFLTHLVRVLDQKSKGAISVS